MVRMNLVARFLQDMKFNPLVVRLSLFLWKTLYSLVCLSDSAILNHSRYNMLFRILRQNQPLTDRYRDDLHRYVSLIEELIPRYECRKDLCVNWSIILKTPVTDNGCVIEKGVMLVTFTTSFEYLIAHVDLECFLSSYYVVLEPSWSGYCDPRILYWTRFPQHKVIIQATEAADFAFIESLQSNLVPVEFGASDWVDDRIFCSIPDIEKEFDAVYVAVFGKYKRHHLLFKAISELNDPTLKVALVGRQWAGTRKEIDDLIDYYGVRQNICMFENLDAHGVNGVLNRSKVNLLLSLREGSNRSVFEGFFADVPAIVLKNNIGIQKKYINEMTGMLIDEKELAGAIKHFRYNWNLFRPRQWASEHISPQRTTSKLNGLLREFARENGEPWHTDIVEKVNNPDVNYYHESDKLRLPAVQDVVDGFLINNE